LQSGRRYSITRFCANKEFRGRLKVLLVVLMVLLGSGMVESVVGQSIIQKPFTFIDAGLLFGSITITDENYGSRWSPTAYYGALVRTDFYAGEVGFRYKKYQYTSKTIEQLRVEADNYGFFWDTRPLKFRNMGLNTGIFVGIHDTKSIKVEGIINKSGEERELILGISGTLSWHLNPVILFSTVSYEKTFNYYRLHQLYAGAGIRVRITIPETVRDGIK
jgi:hypothetical protein